MNQLLIALLLFTMSSGVAFAQKKVAVVKLLKGEVDVLTLGKTTRLKTEDWVEDGSVVKTAEKSFVKLIFIDKSQMNIGPNSEMKIEKFSDKDSGVIDLVKGKIRSQVTKDYLQIQDKDKSKLFIKTSNAVMGVRGTDFIISTNGINTSTVLFEGEIVFNKLDDKSVKSSADLEAIVDKGVRMFPGEFSVVEISRPLPTVPSLLNIQQRENLEKNENFEADRTPSNSANEASAKSVVPPGLDGKVVSNNAETLKTEIGKTNSLKQAQSRNPDGFVTGNKIKPTNGSFLHIESGVIIPPGPGSLLDKNSNTYISGPGNGTIAKDGSFVPPKNMEITDSGKILVASVNKAGQTVIKEMTAPSPVMTNDGSLSTTSGVLTSAEFTPPPVVNDILNTVTNPGGTSNLTQDSGTRVDQSGTTQVSPNANVTIRIK